MFLAKSLATQNALAGAFEPMKRRSFLALLGLSPLAPVAVKAETKRERLPSLLPIFEKHFCAEAQSPTAANAAGRAQMNRADAFVPNQLQKLRVADAQRNIEWTGLSDMEIWPNGAPLLVDGSEIKNRREIKYHGRSNS